MYMKKIQKINCVLWILRVLDFGDNNAKNRSDIFHIVLILFEMVNA